MRNLSICGSFALVLLCSQQEAKGAVVVTVGEVGSDVVVTGSGTLNLGALTLQQGSDEGGGTTSAIGQMLLGPPSNEGLNFWTGASGPTSFGNDSIGFEATSGSGVHFGIYGYYQAILVPFSYASESPISGTSTFANQVLASLHLTPGKYVWTWGTGRMADSFTLQIGEAATAIPEPATLELFALTGLSLMARRRRIH